MNFTAIDFETANALRSSACSVGMVKVREGIIVDRYYSLIKPFPLKFDQRNIGVHGINYQTVEEAPSFWDIWDDMYKFIGDDVVVAHQVSFEKSVIIGNFKEAEQEMPDLTFLCSLYMARVAFPRRENHQLTSLCKEYLDYKFNHHNALEDAEACALMVVHMIENHYSRRPTESIYRGLYNIGYDAVADAERAAQKKRQQQFFVPSVLNSNFFEGEIIVITGKPKHFSDKDSMLNTAVEHGARKAGNVTKTTTILVICDSDYQYQNFGKKSSKQELAERYISLGQNIYIIDEDKFVELLGVSVGKKERGKEVVLFSMG